MPKPPKLVTDICTGSRVSPEILEVMCENKKKGISRNSQNKITNQLDQNTKFKSKLKILIQHIVQKDAQVIKIKLQINWDSLVMNKLLSGLWANIYYP